MTSRARQGSRLVTAYDTGGLGMRNRIINGDMRIDQRNAGASVTAGLGVFAVDRFIVPNNSGAVFTAQRSTVVPAGFSNSLAATVTTAASATAGQVASIVHRVEGFNFADLNFGSSAAQPCTLSFWVRSSVAGTYCVALKNADASRTYVAEYVINSANTWEYKTITIPGDTTGTWPTTNGIGVSVGVDVGSGSNSNTTKDSWQNGNFNNTASQTNWINNSGATFYITGVQLEAGSVATPFERRPYGTELALCQRYLPILGNAASGAYYCMGYAQSSTQANLFYPFKVTPRVPPTGISVANVGSFGATTQAASGTGTSAGFSNATLEGCNFLLTTTATSYSNGMPMYLFSNGTNGQIQFTGCEL
jgi:hypothetical protein